MLETRAILHRINDEDRRAASAVEREIDAIATAVDEIARRLGRGGSLHYFGAGTSGRLGVLDAAEMTPTFSTPPKMVVGHIAGGAEALVRAVEAAEDDEGAGADEVLRAGIGAGDAVVGISASGSAAYVAGAFRSARERGALAVALTNSADSPLESLADVAIVLRTGAEVIAGSTRMKAAAAQKMALAMISTAVMVKLGRVYGNLMVDLAPANAKLRARALRTVAAITGATESAAKDALERSGFRVKIASVMLVKKCDAAEAEAALLAASGSLRTVLGAQVGRSRSE
jgi:N-acetylmuramic acid 6-phosphate etherase